MKNMKDKKFNYSLFLSFFKIGLFTFGGGYAMLPLIEQESVEKRKFITQEDLLDIVAISESTPGPIAINMATFVGYKVCGGLGSLLATLGVILPSFLIISIISIFFKKFEHIQAIKFAFKGIRVGVVVLILRAALKMYKQCPKNIFCYIILSLSFILASFTNTNVLLIIVCSALLGLFYSFLIRKRGNNK